MQFKNPIKLIPIACSQILWLFVQMVMLTGSLRNEKTKKDLNKNKKMTKILFLIYKRHNF